MIKVLLQYVLPIFAVLYLAHKILAIPSTQFSLWASSITWNFSAKFTVFFLIVMAGLNWLLEGLKWKILVKKIEEISLATALGGVLYGVSLGMVTSRHPGEFIGRVVVLKTADKLRGLVLNTAASFSQFFVTLLFGSIGLAFTLISRPNFMTIAHEELIIFYAASGLVIASLLVLNLNKILRWLLAKHWFPQKLRFVEGILSISPAEMKLLLFLSFLRYGIFALQFYLVANLFGIAPSFLDTTVVLSIIYLIMLGLPVSGLADAGVKGSVALMVFNLYLVANLSSFPALDFAVFTTTLSMWFLNLGLPALAGAVVSLGGWLKSSQSASI
jgi:hypothetical protein